jgi:hypothetical protein
MLRQRVTVVSAHVRRGSLRPAIAEARPPAASDIAGCAQGSHVRLLVVVAVVMGLGPVGMVMVVSVPRPAVVPMMMAPLLGVGMRVPPCVAVRLGRVLGVEMRRLARAGVHVDLAQRVVERRNVAKDKRVRAGRRVVVVRNARREVRVIHLGGVCGRCGLECMRTGHGVNAYSAI